MPAIKDLEKVDVDIDDQVAVAGPTYNRSLIPSTNGTGLWVRSRSRGTFEYV